MFNFHKPRVYRSTDGCCICRAKSSSSRFTASRKYEKESMQCFNLNEPRNGEICNACVLLVKRYKRLPVGSKRHWGHVVDARAGPGTKSLAKQKKRENESDGGGGGGGGGSSLSEKFAKILKKNRKVKTTNSAVAPCGDQQQQQMLLLKAQSMRTEEQPSDSNESNDEEQQQQQQFVATTVAAAAMPYQTRKRTAAAALATTTTTTTTTLITTNDKMRLTGSKRRRILQPMKHRRAIDTVPFFEAHDLLRLEVCCGTVFQSLSLGSACFIIDTELYKPCEKHRRRGPQQQQQVLQPQLQQQTVALKKHHLYFKRQSESFPQGDIHRISPIPISIPIPLQKTEPITTTTTNVQQQHSTDGNLALILKSAPTAISSSAGLHASLLTTGAAATTTTAIGAASPSSLSSSSNCSTSSSVATKFNDNSSDSGFDEHVLDRKSVSPPTQDEMQLDNKKVRGAGGLQRLILASGLPISGQTQNLVLTGNEFTARFVQRQQQTLTATQAQPLKITTATGAAAATTTTTLTTGSQNSGNCNKMQMRAIFNNANTIQHENGVTTILPASSIAASNQTAAMNAIAPSTVTITPAKVNTNPIANNPKFILLKPTIGKTPTEVKMA